MIRATFDRRSATPLGGAMPRGGPTRSIRFAAMLGGRDGGERAPAKPAQAGAAAIDGSGQAAPDMPRSPSDRHDRSDRAATDLMPKTVETPATETTRTTPTGTKPRAQRADRSRKSATRTPADAPATPPLPATPAQAAADDLVALFAAIMPSATSATPADTAPADPDGAEDDASAIATEGNAHPAWAPSNTAPKIANDAAAGPSPAIDPAKLMKLAIETLAAGATAIADQPHHPAPASTVASADPSAPADAVTRRLDLAQGSAWLDGLAADIAASAGRDRHLRFVLSPERLGKLVVDLADTADGTALRLTAETGEAHRILTDARPHLVAEARAQGLRIADAQVDLGSPGQDFGRDHGQRGGQPAGQGGEGSPRRSADPQPAPAARRAARATPPSNADRRPAPAPDLYA